jgi:hypothetical protein
VNALRNVHDLIVPDGTLIDLHPVSESHVEARGAALGVIEEPEWFGVTLPNAQAGLDASIREGRYALESEIEFVMFQHFDSVDELVEAKSEYVDVKADMVAQLREIGPPIRTREQYVGRRLRVR